MLGILMLDTQFPRLPGDVGNAGSFTSCAVRHRVVRGASPAAVVRGDDAALLEPFVEAGLALVAEGARALGTSCGFLARWQRELQAALPVPVWSSSLLVLADEARGQRCGVITIEAASLTPRHFEAVGGDAATPVEGITPGSALHRTLLEDLPVLDAADAEAQVLAAGTRLLRRHPELQALVLECTNLPPYAPALRRATGLPVFDVVSMLQGRMARMAGMKGMEGTERIAGAAGTAGMEGSARPAATVERGNR
ncbi:MAG: aspartate/glutamate racemase family protein [Burkholderiales bacterium]|nr:aspartate/glutamate racemase family protein [Burkholderiales bacterium]